MAAGPVSPIALFGLHAAGAALGSDRVEPVELILREGALSRRLEELESHARARGVRVRTAAREELDRLAGGTVHQGVALTLRGWPRRGEGDLAGALRTEGSPFLLILDHLQDVGNLGAVLRSAYLSGVTGVIVPRARSAPLNAAAVRASAGTAVFVDIYQVANLAGVIRKLKEWGIWVFGLEAEGGRNILEADLGVPLALVLGAEHEGLSRLVRESCDMLLWLPMAVGGGSYNASVAAGIAMFEVLRRRAEGAKKKG